MTDVTVSQPAIAIIGGGFSGSLVAANLLRNAAVPLTIKLIEPNPQLGRGVAYQTKFLCHLLNVPAGKMSAFVDEPAHFLNWLHQNGQEQVTASTFVPRQIYGDYVQALLKEAREKAPAYIQLEQIVERAIAIETLPNYTKVYLSSGRCLSVQKVVLALGNFPASWPKPIALLSNRDRYARHGWSAEATYGLNPEDSLLLVGTGLTMADVVVALRSQGFQGQIHAVSRHGLSPHSHQGTSPYPAFIDLETAPKTTRGLLHLVRQEVRSAQAQGQNWRAVFDALRPLTTELWQALPLKEQERFLRHVKAYWEVHRHRIAPEIAENLNAAVQSGQLRYYAGRIQSCQQLGDRVAVTVRERGSHRDLFFQVNRIVNCTGSNSHYSQHPLLVNLQQQGLLRPSPVSIGIDTAPNGALIDAGGNVSQRLYTLGTLRNGNLWESIAVPEIRVQAANLAEEILQSLSLKPMNRFESV
ncbi:MAG: oxidoreductase [Microcystis aeruginosa F13-15]|jgi:uncharacterized NAD(P)/FAD-binding protein YdhS|nr:oxidoreductase [Microcystis aeruginosa F13-15]